MRKRGGEEGGVKRGWGGEEKGKGMRKGGGVEGLRG
jgi:hypothetical protein